MKRGVVIAGVILGITLLFSQAYAADKFAYVDLSKIFAEYNKTKDYDKVLEGKENVYEAERNKKVDEVKQLQDKLELLSDKEKEAKTKDLQEKFKTLQEFDRQQQTDLRKEQDEKMREILKDIEGPVKQYSEKEGYTMVFNDRVLVYQTKSMDISDKIIEIINKGYKK
jgi:Skp family chaperone for outer membrane proteins